ncbi:di-heme oxidoredictase family protein [Prosthecomicrobium pneumaticum]|uniref:CxxC motif-containing protein (DUF1111 family) n=1 Tax=Prosthecomicrobium pneumaticum TaxID=81895 RepID=A0A7W9L1H6_9HYPH|nr:di-heme oxidoredictase family protein [Prosthecomicrobium pneumaticum]MBB5752795.1 CxxC motif-containing protein (DUF1111 family) [Prosthecomicrobium pneumaticum]
MSGSPEAGRRRNSAGRLAALLLALAAVPAAADGLEHALGKALFERNWVAAPASTDAADGLGPLFAERSCAACHSGPAEAARLVAGPNGATHMRGFILRLGDGNGATDPVYGRQIQPRAVQGVRSEGRVTLTADGAGPIAVDFEPARGPLAPAIHVGLRQAPSLRTAAAIAAVDEAAIRAHADPHDRDGDGIAGRVRETADGRAGRFGWKAAFADLDGQIADAFAFDMGLSSPRAPLPHGDCTAAEPDCLAAPTGESAAFDGREISAEMLRLVSAYVAGLKPPAPRPDAAGAALFASTGCSACHVPAMPSKDGPVLIYSDLLLHHLGAGLNDGVGEPGAAAAEWRTAPLIALSARLAGGGRLLHDGRAADADAAIRAHGGEAEAARSRYLDLSAADRAALARFVEGL